MKISGKIKKTTGSLIILGIIIMPFSNVQKVNAQTQVNFGATNSTEGSGNSNSISGYVTGLAPMIAQLPGCRAVLGKNIKNLFTSLSGGDPAVADTAASLEKGGTLYETAARALAKARGTKGADNTNTVQQVNDTEAIKLLKSIVTYDKNIQKSTNSVNENQNCWNAIGKAVIKILIQKMTLGIVNWIQYGNSGKPLFLTDTKQYFADIRKTELLNFGLEINTSGNPFGKAFMQNVASNFNNKFQDNAQYSLNKIIQDTTPQYSAASFSLDFSQGGWNAWEAMTQNPANNPLGFTLMASNELGARLEGTIKSSAEITSDLLQQGNGFLGDERCTDPWGTSREEDNDALKAGVTIEEGSRLVVTEQNPNGPIDSQTGMPTTIGTNQYTTLKRCKKWEYVTPGAVIANKLTTAVNYNDHALLDAETINDAIAAILDATMARFSSELMNANGPGLVGMDTNISNYAQFDSNQMDQMGSGTSQVETDFSNPSSWLLQNPNFNIRTDFSQALIDQQRTYISKLASFNEALDELNTNIYKLDYCIPGPHPGWEEDSRQALNAELDTISPETILTVNKKTSGEVLGMVGSAGPEIGAAAGLVIGAAIGTTCGPIGSAIGAVVGVIAGEVIQLVQDSDDSKKIHSYYAGMIKILTSINVGYDQDDKSDPLLGNLNTHDNLVSVMNTILDRYIEIMHNVFRPEYLPVSAEEAKQEYLKLPAYRELIKENETEIAFRKGIITQMENLKQDIDNKGGPTADSDLDNPNSDTMTQFSRISQYFVSGDDIANIDNIYKETVDKSNHVYNDLLKGPDGCENDMGHFPSYEWQVNDTKRMTYYPLMITGNYHEYPCGIGGDNNTTCGKNNPSKAFGPGFLSYVQYYRTSGNEDTTNLLDRLDVSDLFPTNDKATTVGSKGTQCGSNENCSGVFEKIITVY